MDPLKLLTETIGPEWRYLVAVIAVALYMLPKMGDLYTGWVDIRVGKRELDLERQRLELVKLRYEIEVMRRATPIAGLDEKIAVADAALNAMAQQPAPVRRSSGVRRPPPVDRPRSFILRWLVDHPSVGKVMLPILQLGFGFLLVIFGLTAVIGPIAAATDPELGVAMGIVMALMYGLLAIGSWFAFRRIRQTKLAIIAAEDAAMPGAA